MDWKNLFFSNLPRFFSHWIDNNRHRWSTTLHMHARNSRPTQRETNHYIARCASVLAWCYLAGRLSEQLVIDLFAQHHRFAVCCPLGRILASYPFLKDMSRNVRLIWMSYRRWFLASFIAEHFSWIGFISHRDVILYVLLIPCWKLTLKEMGSEKITWRGEP